ncbi:DUF2076 domain-containing protein [Yokenella regensburgei]|uniref:DUF2076 domain-containing protein n=1 Tax=Yokenella regensburgei TaxID=158877 RepID=UPI0014332664|nr:DUF2076 domain-containing protein [Yokenella regensburgei]QIU91940.1 DUF2076 domain-containing protein [Yokenella regensburgei]
MQSEEQRLIDGLFSRLKQAEANSAPRDATAEGVIAQHVNAQPAAPYYMAQTILIQEAAIKQLNDRIQALESEVSQLQSAKQSSGGFLAGLFGGSNASPQPRAADPIPGADQYAQQYGQRAQNAAPMGQNYAPARGGSGFMAGALQTAAGVAGGVVLGNVLMNMFGGSHPQEIVNIIEEPQQTPQTDTAQAADNNFQNDDSQTWAQNDNGQDNSFFDNNDFGGDDYSNDDDSWV